MTAGFGWMVKSLRGSQLAWRYGFNFLPSLQYALDRNELIRPVERKILDDLNADGISVTSFVELFGDDSAFNDLKDAVQTILGARQQEFVELKRYANETSLVGNKTFNVEMLGSEVVFDPATIFAKLALSDAFLKIADGYLQMSARMRYYNVWKTFATDIEARESQLWHYDREDKLILKAFLYLEDVDEGGGPFTYAPKSHPKGENHGIEPEYILEGVVRRTTDEQMRVVCPEKNWIRGIGKAGTLIFADTRGFHKGGKAKFKDRLMYTCMYTSPASESRNLISFPEKFDKRTLGPKQLRALGL